MEFQIRCFEDELNWSVIFFFQIWQNEPIPAVSIPEEHGYKQLHLRPTWKAQQKSSWKFHTVILKAECNKSHWSFSFLLLIFIYLFIFILSFLRGCCTDFVHESPPQSACWGYCRKCDWIRTCRRCWMGDTVIPVTKSVYCLRLSEPRYWLICAPLKNWKIQDKKLIIFMPMGKLCWIRQKDHLVQ